MKKHEKTSVGPCLKSKEKNTKEKNTFQNNLDRKDTKTKQNQATELKSEPTPILLSSILRRNSPERPEGIKLNHIIIDKDFNRVCTALRTVAKVKSQGEAGPSFAK